jgi:hypothetical protein
MLCCQFTIVNDICQGGGKATQWTADPFIRFESGLWIKSFLIKINKKLLTEIFGVRYTQKEV